MSLQVHLSLNEEYTKVFRASHAAAEVEGLACLELLLCSPLHGTEGSRAAAKSDERL